MSLEIIAVKEEAKACGPVILRLAAVSAMVSVAEKLNEGRLQWILLIKPWLTLRKIRAANGGLECTRFQTLPPQVY
jgi:hypothetical protein